MFRALKEKLYSKYGKFVSLPIILISLGIIQISGITTMQIVTSKDIIISTGFFVSGLILLILFRLKMKKKEK